MIDKKYKKIILICFCIIFIIMSIFSAIMAENKLHTSHCDNPNCHICACINISNNFIKNITLVIGIFILYSCIIPLIQFIKDYTIKLRKNTLVELKVVQNK